MRLQGLSRWCCGKESACQCRKHRRHGFSPGLGRFPAVGDGNPLQYSCLGNPMDRGAWWTSVHGLTKSWTQLSKDAWCIIRLHLILRVLNDFAKFFEVQGAIMLLLLLLLLLKSLQSCLTLCDPIDGSPPGFPVPWSLQARTLEWVAISSSMHESEKWKWSHSVMSD